MDFFNSLRNDGLQLNHWTEVSPDENLDYRLTEYNKIYVKKKYDLKFMVILDHYEHRIKNELWKATNDSRIAEKGTLIALKRYDKCTKERLKTIKHPRLLYRRREIAQSKRKKSFLSNSIMEITNSIFHALISTKKNRCASSSSIGAAAEGTVRSPIIRFDGRNSSRCSYSKFKDPLPNHDMAVEVHVQRFQQKYFALSIELNGSIKAIVGRVNTPKKDDTNNRTNNGSLIYILELLSQLHLRMLKETKFIKFVVVSILYSLICISSKFLFEYCDS
ncbi:hypothetical protein Glove_313g23 [Diversispora epigaea]|uniref:Uncharacterized protein n=1 Tax=Diversispora epigaea TaxID=1348612 RepID=A0A397HYF4_9GLOM|nr:hypothetical protein Glove_313g23 [Diversispora epigaea]